MLDLADPLTLGLIVLSYIIGNMVKGVTGFGAILVAVPLMSMLVEPAIAVALTAVSVVASNIWQLWDSGNARFAVKEFWKVLVFLFPASIVGARFLAVVDPNIMSGVIGAMVVLFCVTQMFPARPCDHRSCIQRPLGSSWKMHHATTIQKSPRRNALQRKLPVFRRGHK